MSRIVFAIAIVIAGTGVGGRFADAQDALESAVAFRFAAVDVYVESAVPLAAWQFELSEGSGAMAVVGVENGDSEVFPDAPHFDRSVIDAGAADRIIVADYSLAAADDLPSGRTRIATVHVRLSGTATPEFELQLIAAGDATGQPIAADAIFEIQDGSEP